MANTEMIEPAEVIFKENIHAEIKRDVEIITLVHGGGVRAGEGDHKYTPSRNIDRVTPLRGTSLRGQLRFWWRATHGCLSGSIAEMKKQEDRIWGNATIRNNDGKITQGPGLVSIRIISALSDPKEINALPRGLKYGAFTTNNLWNVEGKATVITTVNSPDRTIRKQVEDAIDAWLCFGGIGGRTRRGFGAVSVIGKVLSPGKLLKKYKEKNLLSLVPSLHNATHGISHGSWTNADSAHSRVLNEMQSFRQGLNDGRDPPSTNSRSPAGRSRWPEPDFIRKLTGKCARRHHTPRVSVDKMPRGQLGMPLHFKFMSVPNDSAEPDLNELNPDGRERMASPLIIRPFREENGYKILALHLNVPDIHTIFGQFAGNIVNLWLDPAEVPVIIPLSRCTDVVEAFISRIKSV